MSDILFILKKKAPSKGGVSSTPVYTETQTPTINANGLVSIEIGGGAGFNTIDWANGPYFIKTETDPIYTSNQVTNITATDIANLGNSSAVNTGDQDVSETKVTAGTNVTVIGAETTVSPYVVNASGGTTLTIGQSYQGGITFWLDATGHHGLISKHRNTMV